MARRSDPRKLKDAAQAAVEKGKHKKALEKYRELERLEPNDGAWPRRAGEMLRSLEDNEGAIAAWTRAVDAYAEAGFVVKAVAVCKMILRLDSEHTVAQSRLVSLNEARGLSAPAPEPEPVAAPQLEVAAATAASTHVATQAAVQMKAGAPPAMPKAPPPTPEPGRKRTIPPGAALEEVSLRDSVPGATPLEDGGMMFNIPIDLEEEFADLIVPDTGRAATSEALRHTPLFSDLGSESFATLISKITLVDLKPGEILFKQGDGGTGLYVIADGEVAIVAEGKPRVHLSKLGEGEFFGEVALVTNQPRNATVEATQATTLLAIERGVFSDLVEDEPGVLRTLLRFLRDRLIDHLVKTSPLFAPFVGGERSQLAAKFRFLEVASGAAMIKQGERSRGLFVILSGQAEVHRDDGKESRRLATLGPGDVTGEMSLLTNADAIATVRTTGKCLVLALPADVFREVIMTHPQVLMFIGEVADERRRRVEAIVAGTADYQQSHLELI